MSTGTADGFLTRPAGAAHAELERRYRMPLRLYPREFRTWAVTRAIRATRPRRAGAA